MKKGDVITVPEFIERCTTFVWDEMNAMGTITDGAYLFSVEGKNPVTLKVTKVFKEVKENESNCD